MADPEDEIKKLKKQIDELSDQIVRIGRAYEKESEHKIEDLLDRSKERYEQISSKVKSGGKTLDQYTHEHPWNAIAMAAVAGFVLGILTNKDRR